MHSIYVFLADGFEEIEAITIIDVLRRASLHTVTVSISGQKKVLGAHNIAVEADQLFEDTDFSQGQALVLPGGMPGSANLDGYLPLKELIQTYHQANKYLAAICAAPLVLGKMHLLKNKDAVCYPGFEKFLIDANITDQRVVCTDNIITGKGPGAAIAFSLTLVEILKGKETATELAQGMIVD